MSEEDEGMEPVEPEAGQTSPPRDRRWYWVVASLLPIVFLAGIFGFGLGRDPTRSPSVLVGKPAPDFALRDLRTGKVITLASLRGHPVVVNFWATWCPPCLEEHPNLFAAWQRFGDDGVVFLAVLYQDSPRNGLRFMQETGSDWPALDDPGGRTALAFGVTGPPETYFISPDGTIAFKEYGPSSYTLLATEIQRLLPKGAA